MKYKVVSLLLLVPFIILSGCATMNENSRINSGYRNTAWIKISHANVRNGPSTEYDIICRVKINNPVYILKRKDKWIRIKLQNGKKGWIYESLLSDVKLSDSEEKEIIESAQKTYNDRSKKRELDLRPIDGNIPLSSIPKPTSDEVRIYNDINRELNKLSSNNIFFRASEGR